MTRRALLGGGPQTIASVGRERGTGCGRGFLRLRLTSGGVGGFFGGVFRLAGGVRVTGSAPTGSRCIALLRTLPVQAAIGRMRALRGEGLSLRAIRDRLAAEGVKVSHVAVGNALKAGA